MCVWGRVIKGEGERGREIEILTANYVNSLVVIVYKWCVVLTTDMCYYSGAYTTSRTHNSGSVLLFWERHLSRLANYVRILNNSNPELLFDSGMSRAPFLGKFSNWDLVIKLLVNDSMRSALPVAVKEMKVGDELVVMTLLSRNLENLRGNKGLDDEEMFFKVSDVYIRVTLYVPLGFGVREHVAHLAAMGPGRDVTNAKYSGVRKHLEKLRSPSATELLLSNMVIECLRVV